MTKHENDPISRIEWRDTNTLNHNDWNPNCVFTPELKLLEFSILKQGWIQPILINNDGLIIDGFHRASLARDSVKLKEKYAGKVPCVVMDLTRPEAMLLTIRINRAKGSHVAFRMADIIKELIDVHLIDAQQVAKEIGATQDEISLLYQDGVFASKDIKNYKYSKAWYPSDTTLKENQ
jgi:ParB-like chromosome segregation protein Spo0J